MKEKCFTLFSSEIDSSLIPKELNNPFDLETPDVCKIAAKEVYAFIEEHEHEWKHNFGLDVESMQGAKGKMFGVLVVRNADNELGYLFTFSSKLADEGHHTKFVPSLFDVSTDDFFINRGMSELTSLGDKIKSLDDKEEIKKLKEERKKKSLYLQKKLFDSYIFLNARKEKKSLCDIFEALNKKPPAGAGECAAPKLLQYAFDNNMQALAIAEFWWGKASKSGDRQHKMFYPACNDKCRPILGYMLELN
jgi:tRNA pseudouridine32 synthase/23S rRNA pseudouridine746 synthase